MRKNPLNKGIIMENADGIGTVTPAMIEARARELGPINGHGSKPTKADYQQADLVGHSYGGSVITETGTDPSVVGLV
jgi:pimeloyl-ACP methyl ester carboxylesterase